MNLLQWQNDMDTYRENPADEHLKKAIMVRYENSSQAIKDTIKQELMRSIMMKNNSIDALKLFVKEKSDATLIVKSRDDIWFKV